MKDKISIYLLAIKYWSQGDSWKEAKEFAETIVLGFKNNR